jgi:hypothetical protein
LTNDNELSPVGAVASGSLLRLDPLRQNSIESKHSADADDDVSAIRSQWIHSNAVACPFVIGTKDFDNYRNFIDEPKI